VSDAPITQRATIFLYTKGAKIDDAVKDRLIAAGYLPIAVASVDAIRLLETTIAFDPMKMDALLTAALTTVRSSSSPYVKESFANKLCDLLLGRPKT